MKHPREYFKTFLAIARPVICMTSPNISTSHLEVVKIRLVPKGTKRILNFVCTGVRFNEEPDPGITL